MNKSISNRFLEKIIFNERIYNIINMFLNEIEILKILNIFKFKENDYKLIINSILLKYYRKLKLKSFEKNKIFRNLFNKDLFQIDIKNLNNHINDPNEKINFSFKNIDKIFISKVNVGYFYITFYNKIEKKLYIIKKELYNNIGEKNIQKDLKCINDVEIYNSSYYIFYWRENKIYCILENIEEEILLNFKFKIKSFWINYNLLFIEDYEDNIYYLMCKKLLEIKNLVNDFNIEKNLFKKPLDFLVKNIIISKTNIILLSNEGKILYYSYKFNNEEVEYNRIIFIEFQKYKFHKIYTTGINSYIAIIKNEKYDMEKLDKESFLNFLKENNVKVDYNYLKYCDIDLKKIMNRNDDYIVELFNFKNDNELGYFKKNLNDLENGFKDYHKCLIWGYNSQNLGIWTGKKFIKTPEIFVLDNIEKLFYIKKVSLNNNFGFFFTNDKKIHYSFNSNNKKKKNKKNKKSNLINITEIIESQLINNNQKIKDIWVQNEQLYILTEKKYKSKSFNKSFLNPDQIYNKLKKNPDYDITNFIFGLKKNSIELSYENFIESIFSTQDIYYIKDKNSNIIVYDRLERKNILENFLNK